MCTRLSPRRGTTSSVVDMAPRERTRRRSRCFARDAASCRRAAARPEMWIAPTGRRVRPLCGEVAPPGRYNAPAGRTCALATRVWREGRSEASVGGLLKSGRKAARQAAAAVAPRGARGRAAPSIVAKTIRSNLGDARGRGWILRSGGGCIQRAVGSIAL
eukprot:311957-Chlamydomonas_euryale.AAC.9